MQMKNLYQSPFLLILQQEFTFSSNQTKMKKLIHPCILSLALLMNIPVFAQWQQSEGLEGGNITQMISLDSSLIALVKGIGLYRKTGNTAWELVYDEKSIVQIINAENCLIAKGGWEGDICKRSFDGGTSWEEAPVLDGYKAIHCIDSVIFKPLTNAIGRSYDYGNTLDTIQLPVPMQIVDIVPNDSLLFLHLSDGTEEFRLFCSADYGTSWSSITMNGLFDNQPSFMIEQIENINGDLWMQTNALSAPYSIKQVFILDEDCQNWVSVTNNLPIYYEHYDLYEFGGKIFCSIQYHPVFEFNYADSSWIQFADGSKSVNKFLNHNGELFCATGQGACSLDTSGNWETFYNGMNHRTVTSIDRKSNKIYLTASNEVFYSEDGGLSFNPVENIWGKQIITTDSVFYIISDKEFKMSWDEGLTWQAYTDSLNEYFYQRLNYMDISHNCYYLTSHQAVFRTPSDSISWETPLDGQPMSFIPYQVMCMDSTVVVSNNGWTSGYYFSYDNGITFNQSEQWAGGALQRNGQTLFLFVYQDSIYFSEDAGYSWNSIPNPPYGIRNIDQSGDTLIYGGVLVGISSDMGETWTDISDNLPDLGNYYYFLKLFNHRIIAGCPRYGLWYRDDLILGRDDKKNLNNHIVKVYPNPMKTGCKFTYALDKPSEVILNIYDQLGRPVEVVSNNQAAGEHQLQWKAGNHQPGVYFYTLQAGDKIYPGKLILTEQN